MKFVIHAVDIQNIYYDFCKCYLAILNEKNNQPSGNIGTEKVNNFV